MPAGRRANRKQLTLDQARPRTGHGGWRPGSGRPRGRTTVPHVTRPALAARHPAHVTWPIAAGVALGDPATMAIIWRAIADSHKAHFRVVHFNVLRDHLHFLVEATSEVALSRGMQGLGVRLTRRLNRHLGRRGKLLAKRYHAHQLRTPLETRNAIRYVLQNRRHHAAQQGLSLPPRWIDWRSSAPWFDGWRWPVPTGDRRVRRLLRARPPTLPAQTWLLAVGWRRHGLLELDEAPAT